MKVIHLISGGDTGGAKTHIHTLLQGLNRHIQADMVCFTDGPFTQEARDLGIHTDVLSGSPPAVLKALRDKIRQGGYDLIHCHGSRGNLMGALLKRSTGLPLVSTVHSDPRIDYMGRPLAALTFGTLNSWALRRIPNHIGVSRPMVDLLIDRALNDAQRTSTDVTSRLEAMGGFTDSARNSSRNRVSMLLPSCSRMLSTVLWSMTFPCFRKTASSSTFSMSEIRWVEMRTVPSSL